VSAGRFADRVVLITGSTGMAAAAAMSIAEEGGAVFVASRTSDHARDLAGRLAASGGRAAWRTADLSRAEDVEATVANCVAAFGRLDAVYNVAGISGRRFGDGPAHAATPVGWESVIAANATSCFLVCRAAIVQMLAQPPDQHGRRGTILNMSSQLARYPAAEHFATHGYAASKGAIEALTRSLAAYYAPQGIRVNAIAPALVATPMSERAQTDPDVRAYLAVKQPLAGGPIDADDVTATALHLLSDDAAMITGQVVAIDGGWSVSEPPTNGGREQHPET
jgi:NAD(P)-dependent dehydrogenase (short-subunit alcohol dehydrogenase family)